MTIDLIYTETAIDCEKKQCCIWFPVVLEPGSNHAYHGATAPDAASGVDEAASVDLGTTGTSNSDTEPMLAFGAAAVTFAASV